METNLTVWRKLKKIKYKSDKFITKNNEGCLIKHNIFNLWKILRFSIITFFIILKSWGKFIKIEMFESLFSFVINSLLLDYVVFQFSPHIYIIFISRGINIILIKLPWGENSVNTYMRYTEHWIAVSTILGLISSAYLDLHHWRSNHQPQNAENETLQATHKRCQIN